MPEKVLGVDVVAVAVEQLASILTTLYNGRHQGIAPDKLEAYIGRMAVAYQAIYLELSSDTKGAMMRSMVRDELGQQLRGLVAAARSANKPAVKTRCELIRDLFTHSVFKS